MTKELVLYIVGCRKMEGANGLQLLHDFSLVLPIEFPAQFGFNSWKPRKCIESLIARETRLKERKPLGKICSIIKADQSWRRED